MRVYLLSFDIARARKFAGSECMRTLAESNSAIENYVHRVQGYIFQNETKLRCTVYEYTIKSCVVKFQYSYFRLIF